MGVYDAVIVGSGFGGAIPALRLVEAGHKTLLIEQGERLGAKDYKQDWSLRNMDRLFVNYMSADFHVIFRYGRGLGGGSLTYAGACLRAPSEVFDYEDASGYRVWPESVTRAVMEPFFERAERMMLVRQARWDEVPTAGGAFAAMCDAIGRTCDRSRFPYVDCLQCGFCMVGCRFDRKVTLAHSYLPQAEALGLEVRAQTRCLRIRPVADGNWAAVCLDPRGREVEYVGRRLLLAAGALETPAILLRSRDELPELSPQVGENLNNNGDVAMIWHLPEGFPDDPVPYHMSLGRNNAGVITYGFWDEHRVTIHPGCASPALLGALEMQSADEGPPANPIGLGYKDFVRANYPHRLMTGLAIGLVDPVGRVRVDGSGYLRFDFPMNEVLQTYIERVASIGRQLAEGVGGRLLKTNDTGWEHGDAHPLGSCRMGDDPMRAPCDANGALRGYPGVYVTDGAAIPGGTGVNPALTIAANAERLAAHLCGAPEGGSQ